MFCADVIRLQENTVAPDSNPTPVENTQANFKVYTAA
jgi:hypothetical protein